MTFLGELNRDIVDTQKALNDLNESFSIAMQDSKKWTIASRLLSGTGLWSVQNRIRAVISVMAEMDRASITAIENAQKNHELMEKLATRTEQLEKAENNYAIAVGTNAKEVEKAYKDKEKELNKMIKLSENYHNMTNKQLKAELDLLKIDHTSGERKQSLEQKLRDANYDKIKETTIALTEQKEQMEALTPIFEEQQRLIDHYGFEGTET